MADGPPRKGYAWRHCEKIRRREWLGLVSARRWPSVAKVANSKQVATLELLAGFRHSGGRLRRWPPKWLFLYKSAKVAKLSELDTLGLRGYRLTPPPRKRFYKRRLIAFYYFNPISRANSNTKAACSSVGASALGSPDSNRAAIVALMASGGP